MPATWRSVILSPPGTPGMYLPILSSSDNLPSPTSCMSSAPVKVFVTDPIRWWTSTRIRAFVRVSAIPIALTHRPFGVCTATTAPGVDAARNPARAAARSEEHTSELQSHSDLVCRLLLEKKKKTKRTTKKIKKRNKQH